MGLDILKLETWDYLFRQGPYDVIVTTAQTIMNGLNRAFVSMADLNLIVVDEAHHAAGHSSYARIMGAHYWNALPQERPRIFGMTASPLMSKGAYHIAASNLESILDAKIFTASPDLRKEMAIFSTKPQVAVIEYDRADPVFADGPTTKAVAEACAEKHPIAEKYINRMRVYDREYGPLVSDLAWRGSQQEMQNRAQRKIEQLKERLGESGERIPLISSKWLDQLRDEYASETIAQKEHLQERKYASEALANQAMHEVLQNCSPIPDVVTVDASNATPKIRIFLELLQAIGSQACVRQEFCGIVFTKARRTAIALVELLKRIPALQTWLTPEWLVGHVGNPAEAMDWRAQLDTLRRFGRPGSTNLLIATSVAEEGLDVRPCNFIIRFDLFSQHVSFVQSKGRARHAESRFLVMLEKGNRQEYDIVRRVYAADAEITDWLRNLPEDQKALPLLLDDVDMDQAEAGNGDTAGLSESALISPQTGASIRPHDCIALLHYYVSTLSSGESIPFRPIFVLEDDRESHSSQSALLPKLYRCTILLPAQARVRKKVGAWYRGKKEARRAAAFLCCQELFNVGELDCRLLPRKKVKVIAPLSHGGKRSTGAGSAGELQHPHVIQSRMPSQFGDLPRAKDIAEALSLHATFIDIKSIDKESASMLLLTIEPIKALPSVRLYTRTPCLLVPTYDSCSVLLSGTQARAVSRYTYRLLCLMSRRNAAEDDGQDESSRSNETARSGEHLHMKTLPFFLVPAIQDPDNEIDGQGNAFDWVEIHRSEEQLLQSARSVALDIASGKADKCDYVYLQVSSLLHNTPYRLLRLCPDVHPTSRPSEKAAEGGCTSFLEYEQKQRPRARLLDEVKDHESLLAALRIRASLKEHLSQAEETILPVLKETLPILFTLSSACRQLTPTIDERLAA